jgi:hypothetical protein
LGERIDKVRPVFNMNTFMDSDLLKIMATETPLYTDLNRLLESVRLFVIRKPACTRLARDLTHHVGILGINNVCEIDVHPILVTECAVSRRPIPHALVFGFECVLKRLVEVAYLLVAAFSHRRRSRQCTCRSGPEIAADYFEHTAYIFHSGSSSFCCMPDHPVFHIARNHRVLPEQADVRRGH